MRKLLLASVAASMLAPAANAAEVWIGIDASDSVPLFLEDDVAARAGQTVAASVWNLDADDKIFLRSFGEAGVSETQVHVNITIAGRTRPKAVARDLSNAFASFPELVRQEKLTVESRTNVMGWLERIGPMLNCDEEPTTVLIFSDGIEWSQAITGRELIDGAPLPSPSGRILEGCDVEFWGVGQQQKKFGNDDRWYPILKSAWSVWMDDAGAASFRAFASYSR